MRYFVKQRLMGIGDDFDVYNQDGVKQYFIDGKAGSFRTHLIIKSPTGQRLGSITQKSMSFRPTFRIKEGKQTVATVTKSAFTFRNTFIIRFSNGSKVKIIGNPFKYDYKFIDSNKIKIANVSKKFLAIKDSYAIDVIEKADSFILISSSVVIDLLLHNKKKNKKKKKK